MRRQIHLNPKKHKEGRNNLTKGEINTIRRAVHCPLKLSVSVRRLQQVLSKAPHVAYIKKAAVYLTPAYTNKRVE